jgi:hypothetical protein
MTAAESRRARLVSDAVIASYINEISTRPGAGTTPAPERPHAARLAQTRRPLRRREERGHARLVYQSA